MEILFGIRDLLKMMKKLRVQRRVTKLIKGLNGLSYQDRLRQIHLPTLKYRRMRGPWGHDRSL